MKNISLQIIDAASLKKSVDSVNKGNAGNDSAASAENNASFQMMLDKQVQTKNASTQDAQSKQAQNNNAKKSDANEPDSVTITPEPVDARMAQNSVQKASHLKLVMTATKYTKTLKDAETTDLAKADSKSIVEPDIKSKAKSLNNSVEDSKSEDATTSTTGGNLTTSVIAPVILPSAVLENTQVASSISNTNAELVVSKETISAKQRNLGAEIKDTVLNNALSQGKNSNLSEAQDIGIGLVADKQSQNNWIEAMLPNASVKQVNKDDIANLTLNVLKEDSNKEHLIKDVAVSSNFQSTVQINVTEALKQVGSSNNISAYPGKTGWDQAISQKVVWMLGAQEQSATLTLNPPDMGPLQVVIHVHNDQADTTFISDNAEVRQALQDGMDNLRNKMSESGIQLGQANVNSGGQMQQQFQQTTQQKVFSSQQSVDASSIPVEMKVSSQRVVHVANGLVDTFA